MASSHSASKMAVVRRLLLPLLLVGVLAAGLTGCLATQGDTSKVVKLSSVTKDGYAGEAQDDINLLLGEPSQINIDLDPAMTQLESIEVVASQQSDVFRSNNQGSTSNVSREQIDSFPSINRNIQDYVRLDPRIAQTDKARNEISAGGQNTRFNAIRIDGVNTSDAFGLESNSLPTPKQPISMDVIDAIVKVKTGPKGPFEKDAPEEDVTIEKAIRVDADAKKDDEKKDDADKGDDKKDEAKAESKDDEKKDDEKKDD